MSQEKRERFGIQDRTMKLNYKMGFNYKMGYLSMTNVRARILK